MKTAILALSLAAGLVATGATASVINATPGNANASYAANDFTFSWTSAPVSSWVDFESDTAFSLTFSAFTSNGSVNDITGFTLDLMTGGTAVTRYTTDTGNCYSANVAISGDCNLIKKTGGSNALAFEPGDVLLSYLDAGSYRLGIYDSSSPSEASATFTYAAVPLPAGAALMLSALAGLGLARRRKG